jgi:16S rRNA (cytosine1402-N4)-methyltransferase
VKKAFQQGKREGVYSAISEDIITASAEEKRANPRSIPAKLRWAQKESF